MALFSKRSIKQLIYTAFLLLPSIVMAEQCQNYRVFDHQHGVFSYAKIAGTSYNYHHNSRAYLAMTNPERLKEVFNTSQEKAELKKAAQAFKAKIEGYQANCFTVLSSLNIGDYNYIDENFPVIEVSENFYMGFEALYKQKNRFPPFYRLYIANYEQIKPIPMNKVAAEKFLKVAEEQEIRKSLLHKLYFEVVGINQEQKASLYVKINKVEVIEDNAEQALIYQYHIK